MTEHSVQNRDQAIAEIGQLMRVYNITPADLNAIRSEGKSDLITRVLAYVGGVLILAGLSFFLSLQWPKLDSVLRVTLTLGPGIVAAIFALTTTFIQKQGGHLIATPLFALAALFQTTGLFVFLHEYTKGNDATMASLLVFSVMGVQFLAFFGATRKAAPLFLSLIFFHFAFAALFEKIDIDGKYYSAVLGLSGLLIASALSRSQYAPITCLGFIFSGFTFTTALYTILEKTPYDIALIGVAGGMIYASVLTQSRSLLFVSVCTMLGYLGYYTEHYFKDMIGWPLALIMFGIILIVASSYAVRLGRKFST